MFIKKKIEEYCQFKCDKIIIKNEKSTWEGYYRRKCILKYLRERINGGLGRLRKEDI